MLERLLGQVHLNGAVGFVSGFVGAERIRVILQPGSKAVSVKVKNASRSMPVPALAPELWAEVMLRTDRGAVLGQLGFVQCQWPTCSGC